MKVSYKQCGGDTPSACGFLPQYWIIFHSTYGIPQKYWTPSNVLIVSPTALMISPKVLNIPKSTGHLSMYWWYPLIVLLVSLHSTVEGGVTKGFSEEGSRYFWFRYEYVGHKPWRRVWSLTAVQNRFLCVTSIARSRLRTLTTASAGIYQEGFRTEWSLYLSGYIDFRVGDDDTEEGKGADEVSNVTARIALAERSHLLVWQVVQKWFSLKVVHLLKHCEYDSVNRIPTTFNSAVPIWAQ